MMISHQCHNYCVASLQAPVSLCWAGLQPASSPAASPGFHVVHSTGTTPALCSVGTDLAEHGDVSPLSGFLWSACQFHADPRAGLEPGDLRKSSPAGWPWLCLHYVMWLSTHQAEKLPTGCKKPSCHCPPTSAGETWMLLVPGQQHGTHYLEAMAAAMSFLLRAMLLQYFFSLFNLLPVTLGSAPVCASFGRRQSLLSLPRLALHIGRRG